jgi:predicted glycogen debranching enzyme
MMSNAQSTSGGSNTTRTAGVDALEAAGGAALPASLVLEQPLLGQRGADEWLLTNGLGGFAMGTPACGLDRRYHGWLIAALRPPVGRFVALSACAEWLMLRKPAGAGAESGATASAGGRDANFLRVDLSTFVFAESDPARAVESPTGAARLVRFERMSAGAVAWTYRVRDKASGTDCTLRRTLLLHREKNAASIAYDIEGLIGVEAFLEVRPLTPLRDFHDLVERREQVRVRASADERGVRMTHRLADVRIGLREGGAAGRFVDEPQWWNNFCYRRDWQRGQSWREQLWSPGCFVAPVSASAARKTRLEVVVAAGADAGERALAALASCDEAMRGESERLGGLVRAARAQDDPTLARLVVAADQFVVRRVDPTAGPGTQKPLTSIIAGYPWFSDWGRDTSIALPGLLLTCGRFGEALDCLRAFAALRRRGLIPNCFDNGSGQAEYNTVDASLWFVVACCRYAIASGDAGGFDAHLRRACLEIVDAYREGTDHHIRVDPRDGLVSAGDASTQLTWMDARRDGVVFTPRFGKPVEVNALWYNALLMLAGVMEARTPRTARELTQHAELCARNFEPAFWNSAHACLNDVAHAGVFELRPNQIFAIALEHSPVAPPRRSAILEAVRHHLVVREGVRTLAPGSSGYCPRYEGSLFERDRAYHNGTVWPWLLGAYAEAVMRVGGFSDASRTHAATVLSAAASTLEVPRDPRTPAGPLGSVCEVLDAEPGPHGRRPEGCPMQAWSVAELLRVLAMARHGA